jgi:hypothetical protein
VVAGKILAIGIAHDVSRPDHDRPSELERACAGLALAVSGGERPDAGPELRRSHEGERPDPIGADDAGRSAVGVEEHHEGHPFLFDERRGVAPTSGADRRHAASGGEDLVVTIADLTDPLAAGQSAEVAEEQEHMGLLRPQVTQPVLDTRRIGQEQVSEAGDIARHSRRW